MKIRIGLALGTQSIRDESRFSFLIADLERLGYDSLWLSDRLTGSAPEPVVALAFAAGRTQHLKMGTSVLVLPGRNPVVLAKELATLDRLSGGRLLLAVGLGASDAREHQAFGIESGERAPWVEEVVPLLHRLWTEERVAHDGPRFHFRDLTVLPRPIQQPIDIWLGGLAPPALRRIGRLGDGWLPSSCTVADVAAGRATIQRAAADAGRTIDPEHFGVLIVYAKHTIPDALRKTLAARRPDVDPAEIVPVGLPALRDMIWRYVEAGASKFVVRPAEEPADWTTELEDLAGLVRAVQI